jgi:hypothetical protein
MIAQLSPVTALTSDYQQFLNALKASGFRGEISADYASRVVLATDNSIYQRRAASGGVPACDAEDVARVAQADGPNRPTSRWRSRLGAAAPAPTASR